MYWVIKHKTSGEYVNENEREYQKNRNQAKRYPTRASARAACIREVEKVVCVKPKKRFYIESEYGTMYKYDTNRPPWSQVGAKPLLMTRKKAQEIAVKYNWLSNYTVKEMTT